MAWQPTKEIQLVVPFPPGGTTDIVARLVVKEMIKQGVPAIVVNRPGAGSAIGIKSVIVAAPDGQTLLLTGTSFMFNNILKNPGADYDVLASFVHVSLIGTTENHVYASTMSVTEPFSTVIKNTLNGSHSYSWAATSPMAEFIAIMITSAANKAKPQVVVQYKGSSPAHLDLMGGHINFVIDAAGSDGAAAGISTGKTRQVATVNKAGAAETTLDQFIPGAVVQGFFGISVPAGTDANIVSYYKQLINRVLAAPDVQHKLNSMLVNIGSSESDFAKLIENNYKKYSKMYASIKK